MHEVEIIEDIFAAGAPPPDGVLMVHSAFGNLSRAGLRAENLIEGLIGVIPNGTLLMPTFTWRTVTVDNNLFDELATPSITGALTEVFRTQYATHRSLHPTHSTCALGPQAHDFLSEHHLDTNPCSGRSPFAKLAERGAHILLLGVDLESCTLVHVAEELVAPDFYMRPIIEEYDCKDRQGQIHRVHTRRHQRLNRQFTQFEEPLKSRGLMRSGTAHNTPWQLFSAADLYAEVVCTLQANPHGTLERGVYVPEAR